MVRQFHTFLFLLVAFFPAVALAQNAAVNQPAAQSSFAEQTVSELNLDSVTQEVESLRADVDSVASKIDEAAENDDALVSLAVRADEIERALIAKGVEISPLIAQIKTRIDQLGAIPGEGEPAESEIIANERRSLADARARLNQLLGVLEDQSIRVKNILDRISEARRTLFTNSLSRQFDLREAFSGELFEDISDRYTQMSNRVSSWLSFTLRFKQDAVLGSIGAILLLMLGCVWGARRTFSSWIHRDKAAVDPSYFLRLTTAFWYIVLPTALFWAFLGVAFLILQYAGVLRDDIAEILATFLATIGIIFLVWRLVEGVISPSLPNWRLLDISNYAAGPLKVLLLIMIFVSAADVLVTQINAIVGTSVPITIARSLVTSIVVGALLIMIAFLRPFLSATDMLDGGGKPWPTFVKVALCVAGAGLIISALLGYIGFARFVAQQIVVTGAVVATLYLGYRTSHAISSEGALLETSAGHMLTRRYQFSDVGVDRIGLVAGIGLFFLVIVLGLPILALLWGFKWVDVQQFAVSALTDIQIGSISISITSILAGILLFIVGLFVTRRFQKWLDGNVLARSGVEDGARNSIRTAIGYVGVAIAGLLGVSAAGLELSQLALVAGALSLGIGFGLQNIVSNFVSGLILLAERPFKSGDIIEAGAFTGVVKNIKVRATEIETFDKKTLVLPNSELINSAVVNWVHRTTLGRVEVPVGVAYDSDPQQVYDLLLEIANDHPRILGNPEPFVEFANFGDSSLDFVLRGFLADIGFGLSVRTELRMAIFQRFKAAGIEIPFPQRDINLKIDDGKVTEIIKDVAPDSFDVIKTSKKRRMEEED